MTLVELLVVIIVLAILLSLLLPAINGALRTAREAAVLAEINQLATALENFKAKYGDYPPSRILLVENGDYTSYVGNNNSLSQGPVDPTSPGTGDITISQLAQRSVGALRKFFPKMVLNTSGLAGAPPGISKTFWYDFNGDGTGSGLDGNSTQAYVLHGHECLVLFLGGVPVYDPTSQTYGLTGFSNLPANPFTNANMTVTGTSRQQPFFDFNGARLFADPNNPNTGSSPQSVIPGYYDSINYGPPSGGSSTIGFYAYFNAYGSGNYDPNDVNFPGEQDNMLNSPIGLWFNSHGSFAPNPYTVSPSVVLTGPTIFQKPQTFQILSAGTDGLYGVGGQFIANPSAGSATPLPVDLRTNSLVSGTPPITFHGSNPSSGSAETDPSVRLRERDNLTNFKGGRLQ